MNWAVSMIDCFLTLRYCLCILGGDMLVVSSCFIALHVFSSFLSCTFCCGVLCFVLILHHINSDVPCVCVFLSMFEWAGVSPASFIFTPLHDRQSSKSRNCHDEMFLSLSFKVKCFSKAIYQQICSPRQCSVDLVLMRRRIESRLCLTVCWRWGRVCLLSLDCDVCCFIVFHAFAFVYSGLELVCYGLVSLIILFRWFDS